MPTITLATRSVRAGSFSAARNIAANVSGVYNIALDVAEPDLSDPAKTASIVVERSPDGGATWQFVRAITWQGGPPTRPGASRQPACGGAAAEIAGFRARGTVTLGASTNTGLIIVLP